MTESKTQNNQTDGSEELKDSDLESISGGVKTSPQIHAKSKSKFSKVNDQIQTKWDDMEK